MKKTLLIFGLLLLSVWSAPAQTSGNPFELTYRLKDTSAAQAVPLPAEGHNPFDLIAPTIDKPHTRAKATIARPKKTPLTKAELGNDNSFVFTVQIIGLLFLTLLITLMRSIFQKATRSIFSENMLNQVYRERTSGLLIPFLTAYSLFFYNAGLLLFLLLLRYFEAPFYYPYWATLLMCIAVVLAAFMIKHLLVAIVGALYPVSKEASMYSFTIMIFAIALGVALTPLNLAIAYVRVPNAASLFVYISFCVVGVIYLLRTFRALSIANKFLIYYKFHFLLYICAIEIAPVMVLIRMISMVQDNI